MYYTCITCITIDSVMRIDEKTTRRFIQKSVNIGQKKIKMSNFINTELKSDSDSDSELDSEKSKFHAELMTKLKSGSDSE